MGRHDRRRSSLHYTHEAAALKMNMNMNLGLNIDLSRRVEHRHHKRSDRSEHSDRRDRDRRRSISHFVHVAEHRSPSPAKIKESSHHYHHYYYPCPAPAPALEPKSDAHAFLLATDETYARLFAKLERLKGHKSVVRAYVRELRTGGLEGLLAELREEIKGLEEVLEGMRRLVDGGDGEGWGVWRVGGRWVEFL